MPDSTAPPLSLAVIGGLDRRTEAEVRALPSAVLPTPLGASAIRQLLASVLDVGGRLWVNGTGFSMTPTVREGDQILLQRIERRLRRGDLVLVESGSHYVLHRVMRVAGEAVELRGDGLRGPPERVPRARVVALAVALRRMGRLRSATLSLEFGWSALMRHGVDELRRHSYRFRLFLQARRHQSG